MTIVYETPRYWVEQTATGYRVWRIGATASIRVATCGYPGERGLSWCKAEIARREREDLTRGAEGA